MSEFDSALDIDATVDSSKTGVDPIKKAFNQEGISFASVETLKGVESKTTSPRKTYSCIIETYLKDSNAYGNIYFSRYFEWQGVVREKWFSECIFHNMFELEVVIITKSASMEYKKSAYPFEKIYSELVLKNIRKTSFDIWISFFRSNELLAIGWQTIVFADKTGKIVKIPENILNKICEYAFF